MEALHTLEDTGSPKKAIYSKRVEQQAQLPAFQVGYQSYMQRMQPQQGQEEE